MRNIWLILWIICLKLFKFFTGSSLFQEFFETNIKSDHLTYWSCILSDMVKYQMWSDPSKSSQIIRGLSNEQQFKLLMGRLPFFVKIIKLHPRAPYLNKIPTVLYSLWSLIVDENVGSLIKNPAYGRHQLSRPMRIIGLIKIWRGCMIYL